MGDKSTPRSILPDVTLDYFRAPVRTSTSSFQQRGAWHGLQHFPEDLAHRSPDFRAFLIPSEALKPEKPLRPHSHKTKAGKTVLHRK